MNRNLWCCISKNIIYFSKIFSKIVLKLPIGGILNGQKKYRFENKICIEENCNCIETIEHYLIKCSKWNHARKIMLEQMNDLAYIDLESLQTTNLLKHILYPMNDKIYDQEFMSDKKNRKELYDKRIESLNLLSDFITETKRFESIWNYDYKSW